MLYANHQHWPQNRPHYQDDDESYYSPTAYQRPQQSVPPPRRRPNSVQQDPTHLHFYPRHRDDRDGWPTSSLPPDVVPPGQPPRRQPSTATNSTSDYSTRPRSRCGRSASATRGTRSKSTSPRRHAAPLSTAPSIPHPSVSERETLVRERLRNTFETYVFNTLPTHLLRITDMVLLTRNEIWDIFRPRIESLSDTHLARLLLEQDEEARRLGVSVLDPEVLAPFTEYIRTMFSFAIFSHKRSNTSESLFQDLASRRLQVAKRPGPAGPEYQKLAKFCEKAKTDYGCEYGWADICCINRESGSEIEEATLSMSLWYSEARICIIHLADSSRLEDLVSDPWLAASWTLPELLFARKVRFYGKDWSPICPGVMDGRKEERAGRENREEQRINDKDNEAVIITLTKATGIPDTDIRNFVPSCTRVSEKMKWASLRTTCRIEDMAYSLVALFDVTIPISYGEGPRAFHKLMTTIVEQCTEPDLFAWSGKPSRWSLALPSSPQCYGGQAPQSDFSSSALGDPTYEVTKLGLRIRLVLVPAYCEPLEPTDANSARFLLAPALPTQDSIQVYVPHSHEQDPRETHGRGREYALGVVDYDARAGPPGYAGLHAGWAHLCLVLERERRGRGWLRVARPGAVNVRFRESELLQVESVCLLHRA